MTRLAFPRPVGGVDPLEAAQEEGEARRLGAQEEGEARVVSLTDLSTNTLATRWSQHFMDGPNFSFHSCQMKNKAHSGE